MIYGDHLPKQNYVRGNITKITRALGAKREMLILS
jgi:hypothetical protein